MVGFCAEGGRSRAWEVRGGGVSAEWNSGRFLAILARPLQVPLYFFSPPSSTSHQTTTRPRPSLELTSSCFYNLRRTRTHAPAGTPPRDVGKNTRMCRREAKEKEKAQASSHGCGQRVPTIYNAQTLSCAYYF